MLAPTIADPQYNIAFLKASRLFSGAADELVCGSQHLFVQRTYAKGSVIFEQGDSACLVYSVCRGKVRIARRTEDDKQITVSILGPGDLFGEEVVFEAVTRPSTVTCLDTTTVWMARASDLLGLLSRYPVLSLNLARYLREQLDDARCATEDVAYLNVGDRLTRLLERLAAEHSRPVEDGTLLDVRQTRAEIASLIGSTRETVSVRIAGLVRAGRIALRGKQIVLLHQT